MHDAPAHDWDLFISHAVEDKKSFVEPLAHALSRFGLRVWYDDYTLKVGDSLSRSIDEGLAHSKYGLVVLSDSFIEKKWTEYELRGLTAREIAGSKVILPIWHNVQYEDLLKFSPTLADKLAVKSNGLTPAQIAIKIIEVVRPDIFSHILRRIAFQRAVSNGARAFVAPKDLRPSDFRHVELSQELMGRLRILRAALFEVFPLSMAAWVDNFKRELYPADEIRIWERVAAVLFECCIAYPQLTTDQKKKIFELICSHWTANPEDAVEDAFRALPEGTVEMVVRSYASPTPLQDMGKSSTWSSDNQTTSKD